MSTSPILEVPFVRGFDESIRPEVLDPAVGYTTLENVRMNARGALNKRLGFTAMATARLDATSRSSGLRLLPHRESMGVIDAAPSLDVISEIINAWVNVGRVPEATVRRRPCPAFDSNVTVTDCVCASTGYVAIAAKVSVTGGDLHPVVVIIDPAGLVVHGPTLLVSARGRVKLATYGTRVMAFCGRTSIDPNEDIYALHIDTTSAATITTGWTSLGVVVSDAASSMIFDLVSLDDRVALAYVNDDAIGSNQVTVKTFTVAGVVETAVLSTGVFTPSDVTMAEGVTSPLWVGWAKLTSAAGPYVTQFDVIALDPTNIDGAPLGSVGAILTTSRTESVNSHGDIWLSPLDTNQVALYAVNRNAANADGIYIRGAEISGGVVVDMSIGGKIGGASMVGRPFLYEGRVYAPLTGRAQEELVLCDVHPITDVEGADIVAFRPVAAPLQQGLRGNIDAAPKNRTAFIDDTRALFAFSVKTSGVSLMGSTSNSAALIEYDFADPDRWHSVAVNGSTYVGGGVVSIFDGQRLLEANFLTRPKVVEVNVATAGAQTFAVGRNYVATFEHRDADGNWHISGVSDPVGTGAIDTQEVLVRVAPLSITSRVPRDQDSITYGSGVRIGIWATTDGAQPPYHRIASLNNDTLTEYIEYEDAHGDAAVEQGDLLYGTGNLPATGASQDHRAPIGMKHIVSYNGMLVGANTSSIYFSSQPIDGEGQWFSPLFAQPLDSEITALTVQDGAVIAFTRTGAWAGSGEPPSDNLSIGGMSPFRKLSIDHGCVNSNSLVTTSVGTFYQSPRGIELLTRGLTVQPIGAAIQDTFAEFPWVSAAVLDPRDGLVRISLVASEADSIVSTNGRDVVYDLAFGIWISTDVRAGSIAAQSSQDACMAHVDGDDWYAWLGTNGVVYIQNDDGHASAHLDVAAWVGMKAITSWVHIAGIHGEQFVDQVLMLLRRSTGHDLTISLAFDYSDSYATTKTFTAAQIAALQVREWLVKEVTQTTSNAIRVKIEDATPSSGSVGTGAGSEWVAVTFNGIPHQGPKRSTGAQRGGT